ncbi:hypothetical protein FHL15_001530 [Xylaria flabelliformis]|uniref:YTH domain-containing protein n=1 Tax=Xylaria flabelliformis TaxID=2512241 RepID=A0A553IC40_9PEZI|nr:hypothetical protein FHL15_001530 [Xylaria flabelliformis]
MGDNLPSANSGGDGASSGVPGNSHQVMMPDDGSSADQQSTSPSNSAAFQGQYQQIYAPSSNLFSGQLEVPLAQGSARQGPYDMSAVTNALPQAGYRPGYSIGQQHQRYAPSGPSMMPQMVQYPGQPHISQLANQHYYLPQHQHIPQYYSSQMSPTVQQHQQHQVGSPRDSIGMGYYPNVMINQSQPPVSGYYYPPSSQFSAQNPPIHNPLAQQPYFLPDGSPGGPKDPQSLQRNNHVRSSGGFVSSEDLTGTRPNIVRGPPRKPRQSGQFECPAPAKSPNTIARTRHLDWESSPTNRIDELSVPYEASCVTAQQKLHDSKFQSVRLVSRLRKSTVEGMSGQTAPTGPAAISPGVQNTSSDRPSSKSTNKSANLSSTQEDGIGAKTTPVVDGTQQRDKFFILKSLTVEDLDLSIQNGVWATQSHNEEALNDAFGAADNVYLIFSANKSGEYFGYARMISPINHDPAAAIEFAPKAQATSSMDLPKAIPTEATDTCPRGRIIDDSARGTIFWEVERDESDGASDIASEDSESARSTHDGEGGSKAWGKPFKLDWLSTTRLPFYKTRGLRNPWNSNREVKIARDGTELEPTVGRKLIGLFNRVQSPIPLSTLGVAGIAAGYPPQATPHFQ